MMESPGMGFIGSNFIRHMLTSYEDINIINPDRPSYGSNPANLTDIENNPYGLLTNIQRPTERHDPGLFCRRQPHDRKSDKHPREIDLMARR